MRRVRPDAVTTGGTIQVFAWLATIRRGRVRLATPMLFVLGFFVVFTIGGLTGVMLAVLPFDWQAHDTHFVVAHLHDDTRLLWHYLVAQGLVGLGLTHVIPRALD